MVGKLSTKYFGGCKKQYHIRNHCILYEDIRKKYRDLDDKGKPVGFFKEVFQRSDAFKEKEKEEKRSRGRKEQ